MVLCVFCGWLEVMKPRIDPGTTEAWLRMCRGLVAAHRSCGALRCECRGPATASTAFSLRVFETVAVAVRVADISRVTRASLERGCGSVVMIRYVGSKQKKMILQRNLPCRCR